MPIIHNERNRTNGMVRYFNGAINGIILHYCLMNFVEDSHVSDPGQSLLNDHFPVVSIV